MPPQIPSRPTREMAVVPPERSRLRRREMMDDDKKAEMLRSLKQMDLQFERMDRAPRLDFPPALVDDSGAIAQMKHFNDCLDKIDLSPETSATAVSAVAAAIDHLIDKFDPTDVLISQTAAAKQALAEQRDAMTFACHLLANRYLALKPNPSSDTMNSFTSLQRALNDLWADYYNFLERRRITLLGNVDFVECITRLTDKQRASLWSALMANVMPCEVNKDAPLRLLAWSKTIQAQP